MIKAILISVAGFSKHVTLLSNKYHIVFWSYCQISDL